MHSESEIRKLVCWNMVFVPADERVTYVANFILFYFFFVPLILFNFGHRVHVHVHKIILPASGIKIKLKSHWKYVFAWRFHEQNECTFHIQTLCMAFIMRKIHFSIFFLLFFSVGRIKLLKTM